jgi:histone H3/H4
VAKVIGKLWSSLSDKDKAVYQQQAAEERECVSKLVENYKDAMPKTTTTTTTMDNNSKDPAAVLMMLQLPAARIRKICKLDPQVKGLSKEALALITKCAEKMTVKLGMETLNVAQLQNRRTILIDDVAHVCANREQFLFLKEDLRDLQKEQQQQQAHKGKISPATITNSKPLTDYFQHSK